MGGRTHGSRLVPLVGSIATSLSASRAAAFVSLRQETDRFIASGIEKRKAGDWKGAIEDFTRAIESAPKLSRAYALRADAWYEKFVRTGNKDSLAPAIADCTRAIELDPSSQNSSRFILWLIRVKMESLQAANAELSLHLKSRPKEEGDDWGRTIGSFLVGELSESDFLHTMNSGKEEIVRRLRCLGYYYAGMKHAVSGEEKKARECLTKCLDTGDKLPLQYPSAKIQLALFSKAPTQQDPPVNKSCPVDGKPVDASFTTTHEAKSVAFCCGGCKSRFQANPEKYAGNIPRPQDETGLKAQVGQPAPNFTLADTEGKKVSLSDFKGKIVVFNGSTRKGR